MCDGDIVVIRICCHHVESNATPGGETHANTYITVRAKVFWGIIATGAGSYYMTYLFGGQKHLAERSVKG